MSVSVVVQRFRECKLLLLETEYITVGGGDDSCGLLAYVSFAAAATPAQAEQAAHTLLHLPVLTTGLWGDGAAPPRSLLDLTADATVSCALVLVPQANLISKVKQGGRSIQYHGQIDKERGEGLYNRFCNAARGGLLEAQCAGMGVETPAWYAKRQAHFTRQDDKPRVAPRTPPEQLFRDEAKYSEWDDRGVPTKDAEGQDLAKSQLKKLAKAYQAHAKKHEKWKEQHDGAEANRANEADQAETPAAPPPARWDEDLDPAFCRVVAGSFGMRQGLELRSDMGPFVHTFQI